MTWEEIVMSEPLEGGHETWIEAHGLCDTVCPLCEVKGQEIKSKVICPSCHRVISNCCGD